MNNTKSKYKVNRELKIAVPKALLKQLADAMENYGAGQTLSKETRISYNTIAAAMKTGLATQTTIDHLEQAFKKIAA